jgi:hypothetical protein
VSSELQPHIWLPEPNLAFHPDRSADVDIHPLRGLLRFGPYSRGLVPDPIRVATIAPAGNSRALYDFMKELSATYEPTERREYLQKWPGFSAAFGVRVTAAGGACHLELESEFEREFESSSAPHVVLADRLVRAIQNLEASRSEFDVLVL